MVYQRINIDEIVFISIQLKENWDWQHKEAGDKEVNNILSALILV